MILLRRTIKIIILYYIENKGKSLYMYLVRIYNIIYNVMLYLSNHSYLWTIANSVLLVAKGREVGRQHDLFFLFLLVLGGSGGSSGAAPRVAPRSGPGGDGGCTMRVPTRSRTLKKKRIFGLSLLQYCVAGMFIYWIPDPHFSISDQGPKVPGSRSAIKEFKYY